MFPNVGQAMVDVLERLGCETFLPEQQVCCGQPTYNSGYSKGSMKTFKIRLIGRKKGAHRSVIKRRTPS